MRIMIYYDSIDHAKNIIPVVKRHAQSFHAIIDIVGFIHVTGQPHLDDINIKKKEVEFQYIKGVLEKDGIPCVTHILISSHDEKVDVGRFIMENVIDEIILCTDKSLTLMEPIPGSLEDQVISHARCPVVFV